MTEPVELEKRLELLQGISIFFTLPDRDVRRLARKLQPRQVARGEEVVKQGDVTDRMHIIVSGRCEVRETWAPHHSVTVAVLGPGDFFGLSAMKGGTPQAASVTSIEPCELLELLTEDIDYVLTEGSPVRAEVDRLVEQRRDMTEHLVDLHLFRQHIVFQRIVYDLPFMLKQPRTKRHQITRRDFHAVTVPVLSAQVVRDMARKL